MCIMCGYLCIMCIHASVHVRAYTCNLYKFICVTYVWISSHVSMCTCKFIHERICGGCFVNVYICLHMWACMYIVCACLVFMHAYFCVCVFMCVHEHMVSSFFFFSEKWGLMKLWWCQWQNRSSEASSVWSLIPDSELPCVNFAKLKFSSLEYKCQSWVTIIMGGGST